MAALNGDDFAAPTDVGALVLDHYGSILSFYGMDLGLRVARKHLGWYMDQAGTPADLRGRILRSRDVSEVQALLPEALVEHAPERAVA